MNLNEKCLLDFLQNPDELECLTKILEDAINFVKDGNVLRPKTIV